MTTIPAPCTLNEDKLGVAHTGLAELRKLVVKEGTRWVFTGASKTCVALLAMEAFLQHLQTAMKTEAALRCRVLIVALHGHDVPVLLRCFRCALRRVVSSPLTETDSDGWSFFFCYREPKGTPVAGLRECLLRKTQFAVKLLAVLYLVVRAVEPTTTPRELGMLRVYVGRVEVAINDEVGEEAQRETRAVALMYRCDKNKTAASPCPGAVDTLCIPAHPVGAPENTDDSVQRGTEVCVVACRGEGAKVSGLPLAPGPCPCPVEVTNMRKRRRHTGELGV